MSEPAQLHVIERGPLEAGPAAGSLAVLVHGSMDRASSFGRITNRLKDWTVLSYDRRGYAGSHSVGPSDEFSAQTDDLLEVLAGRQAVGVGHSLGASVVLAAAGRCPGLIDTAVVWEPPMSWAEWWPAPVSRRLRSNRASPMSPDVTSSPASTAGGADPAPTIPAIREDRPDREEGPEDAAEAFMRRVVTDRIWERLPLATRRQRRAEGETLVAESRGLRRACPYRAEQIAIPVLVGYGSETSWYHRRAAEEFAATLPRGELATIAGAGHGAHLSHPTEFAAIIREALDRRSD